MTGEIFVEEGLEDALNVDRDSFNRFHPEYRAVQKYVHGLLHSQVFPEVYQEIEERSKERTKGREKTRRSELKEVIARSVGTPVQVAFRSGARQEEEQEVVIEETPRAVRVVIPQPKFLKTKKSNQQLASSVMAIFEVAMRERSREKQREAFKKLLLDLLARW